MRESIGLPLFERILPSGFDYGANYIVEFEPQSLWFDTSFAMVASALRSGIKTDYHTFTRMPSDVKAALERLGVDVRRFETDDSFRIWDSYSVQTRIGEALKVGSASPRERVDIRSIKIEDWDKGTLDELSTDVPQTEKRRLHIDDNTSVLLQYNDPMRVAEHFRTLTIPYARRLELAAIHSLLVGVYPDAFYRQFESFCDGVIDFRSVEEGGEMRHYMRARVMRGKDFDSRWWNLKLLPSGEVTAEPTRTQSIDTAGQTTAMERGAEGRRLAAIMFTDMVGYTAIGKVDEARSLRLLEEHRSLLRPLFAKHAGREVKTMGDAFLVEFASAVEAVNCAVEVQREMISFNSGRGPTDKILVRIGVHVGDIVNSDGDVLGDAVNVAARVQPIAEPGGVCVTRQVVDQIGGKVDYRVEKIGMRELKNIPAPVEIFRIVLPSEMSQFKETPSLDPHRVAILPLTNMSADPNDRYFADGMTEELISTVSRIGELSVISRTSVMRYKETTLSMGQIGIELGAGTILEGSVRKAGNRVRITAQLIEAGSDRHLWSQSYDRDLIDVFAIQGDIAQQVAEALKVKLLEGEKASLQRKATSSPEAYSLYLKGRFYWSERTEDGTKKALKYFGEAVKVDPNFALAYSGIADCYSILSDRRWMPPSEAAPLAKSNAMRALELDDGLAEAHASLGLVLVNHFWDFGNGEREFKRSIELNPNYAAAYHWYSIALSFMKRYEDGLGMVRRASTLDPYSRAISTGVGTGLLELERYEEAIEQLKKVAALNPDFQGVHLWLANAYCCVEQFDRALESAKKVLELGGESASMKLLLGRVYVKAGDSESAEKMLNEARTGDSPASPAMVASVLLAMGRTDEGYDWLEKALVERDPGLLYFPAFPWNRPYLNDPRWAEIERKMGIPRNTGESR
ncbi:MAG: tetratricopeptide repeat protein [Nitrososphaerales archaeon]|nr:tetratricopeptide repeat protein [Nitrososphaerales archaeon]